MIEKKLTALLGLAQKAGKIVSGEFAVEQAIRNRKALLVMIACDASAASKKNYLQIAEFYGVPHWEILSKEQMGLSIGKAHRASIAIIDRGFAQAVNKLKDSNME